MAALEFPENPVLNQTYDFPPFQYIWDGVKWKTVGRGADTVAEAINAHKLAVDQHPISGIIGLQAALDELTKNAGKPVLSTEWVAKRTAMWTGYAAGDGQELSRTLYPDAWAAIAAGLVPVCTRAEWIADPAKRGCYHTGDGSTTFGLPDYNGAQPGSYGPVYLGGGTTDGGTILRDRIQNLTGDVWANQAKYGLTSNGNTSNTGVFTHGSETGAGYLNGTGGGTDNADYNKRAIRFDASRVARTGDTTRPITAEGCIAIKLFGAVQNTGSADAAALATAVAALAARVTALEARKSTCLVNATGTGAPHETVSAALPANLAINMRYVLANPFGVNVPVECWAEVKVSNAWYRTGWIYASPNSYGVNAHYAQGEGIIIRTGKAYLLTVAYNAGGSGPDSIGDVTSAPCRIFIRRIDD